MRGAEEASSKGGCACVYVLAQRLEVVLRAHARAEAGSGAGVPGQLRDMEGFAGGCRLPCEGPAEEAEPQVAAWSGDSGNVSQSHSSASVPWEDEGPESGAPSRDLPLLRRAASGYAACLLPGAGARPEVEELESHWCEVATASRSVRKRSPWLQLPGRGE